MVKTIFILTSLAILALLTLIIKTTSFRSEPKAKGLNDYSANCAEKFASKYGTNSTAVLNAAPIMASEPPFTTIYVVSKCSGDYVGIGALKGIITVSGGHQYRCCVRKDVDRYWSDKKNTATASTATPTTVNDEPGKALKDCGSNHVNCSTSFVNNSPYSRMTSDNGTTLQPVCTRAAADAEAVASYHCAVKVSNTVTSCDGNQYSYYYQTNTGSVGLGCNVTTTGGSSTTPGGIFRVCFFENLGNKTYSDCKAVSDSR